jgi:hypothetical protein
MVIDQMSGGVRELKVWKTLAHVGPRRMSVRQAGSSGMSERGRGVEAVMIAFNRHRGYLPSRFDDVMILAFFMLIHNFTMPARAA